VLLVPSKHTHKYTNTREQLIRIVRICEDVLTFWWHLTIGRLLLSTYSRVWISIEPVNAADPIVLIKWIGNNGGLLNEYFVRVGFSWNGFTPVSEPNVTRTKRLKAPTDYRKPTMDGSTIQFRRAVTISMSQEARYRYRVFFMFPLPRVHLKDKIYVNWTSYIIFVRRDNTRQRVQVRAI